MSEAILPGVLIDVRPEGLIVPGAITVGNIGIVGTAAKGTPDKAVILGSYPQAVQEFGPYDRLPDPPGAELTLVRALEQAYRHGATTVFAVRVAEGAQAARLTLLAGTDDCVRLEASSPGSWANELTVEVVAADEHALVRDEEVEVTGTGPATATLAHPNVVKSAQNRIVIQPTSGADLVPTIVYDATPGANEVRIDTDGTGTVTFGTDPAGGSKVLVTYTVDKSAAVKVTLASPTAEESYNVVSGTDLISDLEADSALATGTPLTAPGATPSPVGASPLSGGTNGVSGADYEAGLGVLLGHDAHIVLAAGQDDQKMGNALARHTAAASGDAIKRERIAVVGSKHDVAVDDLLGHSLNSDRVVLAAPGIKAKDNSQTPAPDVLLPGGYTAAAVAGKLSSLSAHISPTNKVLPVDGLEHDFTRAELGQLVQSRVLVLERRQGFRITKGITTSSNTAWHQITTRRIVDFAKLGVRSAATPYIGLLNNERVRAAMRATINSFLTTMVDDEMLISYELDVSATRAEEIRGIARVELVLRPTFSIDFIKVTMFLE